MSGLSMSSLTYILSRMTRAHLWIVSQNVVVSFICTLHRTIMCPPPHTHMNVYKSSELWVLNCFNVSFLVVIWYYSYVRCYYWCEGYLESSCIISYKCTWIFNCLKIESWLKCGCREPRMDFWIKASLKKWGNVTTKAKWGKWKKNHF